MVTLTDSEQLHLALEPLIVPLYETLQAAVDTVIPQCADWGIGSHDYQAARSHLTRALWRRKLSDWQLLDGLDGWRVNPPQPNVQLALSRDLLSLRMLRPSSGFLPSPGPNVARQVYYQNRNVDLFGCMASQLVALWAPDTDGELRIRIVRPIGTDPESKRADLSFVLPRAPEQFDLLEFVPQDDLGLGGLYDIPAVEDESDGSA